MMLATRIIHTYQLFLYTTFQKMKFYSQNGRVSIVDTEKILIFNIVGLMGCTKIQNAGMPERRNTETRNTKLLNSERILAKNK